MTADIYFTAGLWMALALAASLISIRIGVSVALIEIGMGIIGGNFLHLHVTDWITFLASFGSVLLTFLAGAELDPRLMRARIKETAGIGIVSFLFPFLGAFAFCLFIARWTVHASEIGGIALSTASVAVVYAVMVESGLNKTAFGKVILSAVFVTDLGTVLALGILFATFNSTMLLFVGVTIPVVLLIPRVTRWYFALVGNRVSEPEIKYVFVLLFLLGGLATLAKSEAVLPAYLIGVAMAGPFLENAVLAHRTRSIAFTLLTPFYFMKAGLFVLLPAVVANAFLIIVLFLVKMVSKFVGVYPISGLFRFSRRDSAYITAMMSTGLTFGTISSLYGLTHHLISQTQYTMLVTVVIGSAVIPTLIGQAFFRPAMRTSDGSREADAVQPTGTRDNQIMRWRAAGEGEAIGDCREARPPGVVGDRRWSTHPGVTGSLVVSGGHGDVRAAMGAYVAPASPTKTGRDRYGEIRVPVKVARPEATTLPPGAPRVNVSCPWKVLPPPPTVIVALTLNRPPNRP